MKGNEFNPSRNSSAAAEYCLPQELVWKAGKLTFPTSSYSLTQKPHIQSNSRVIRHQARDRRWLFQRAKVGGQQVSCSEHLFKEQSQTPKPTHTHKRTPNKRAATTTKQETHLESNQTKRKPKRRTKQNHPKQTKSNQNNTKSRDE